MTLDYSRLPAPLFLMEESKLKYNLEILGEVKARSGAIILCALKAFSMYHTFPLVRKYLDGTTASSLNEAMLGEQEFQKQVHAYCPAYLPSEFSELARICSHITFNSISQFQKYRDQAQAGGVSCGIRINPEYSEISVDLYNPGRRGSRLGLPVETLGKRLPEGVEGLHVHTLFEDSAETLENMVAVLETKFKTYLSDIKWLNLGGGHAITRKGYRIDLLVEIIRKLKDKYDVEVILEPGSAVAWETGVLIATVLDIVENQGVRTAMLDVSFAAHMPDTLEMPYRPSVLGEKKNGRFHYHLGGGTCLAGDVIYDYYFDEPLHPGDHVVFLDMMHYTLVKTTTFNGVHHPSLAILRENGQLDMLKQFGYDAFKLKL